VKTRALAEFVWSRGWVLGFARRDAGAGVGEEEDGRGGCGGAVGGWDGSCETCGCLRGVEERGVDIDVDVGRSEAPGGTVDACAVDEEKKEVGGGGAPGVTVGVGRRGFMRGGSLGEPALARPAAAVLAESCRSTSRMGVATPQF